MNLRIVLAIVRKDVVDAIRNTYILFSLILPIGMSLLMGVMMPQDNKERPLDIVVYDPGQSRLVERLKANPAVSIIAVSSVDEVRTRVEKGAIGGLVLADDFDAAVAAGETPELPLYYKGQRGNGEQAAFRQMVESSLRAMAAQTMPAKVVPIDVTASAQEGEIQGMSYSQYLLILFLVLGLTMVGVFVVPTILVEEKEKHTLQAVLVSPASYTDLVTGKALVGLVYSLLMALILLLLNDGFSGNVTVTLLAVVLGSLFLVQCGLLLGAVFSTTTQVNTWSSIVMLALIFPAMFILPPQPPEPIPTVTGLVPTSHIAKAIGLGLSNKATLTSVGPHLIVLAAAAVIVFVAVILVLRRERR